MNMNTLRRVERLEADNLPRKVRYIAVETLEEGAAEIDWHRLNHPEDAAATLVIVATGISRAPSDVDEEYEPAIETTEFEAHLAALETKGGQK